MSDNPSSFVEPVPPVLPALVHMDALPAGTRLGEFEIQALLGVGGFGMVYRGYDHSLHREVAIKEYMPAALVGRLPSLHVTARSAADQQPFERGLASFMAEARVLARFDHPSLVKVYRFWEANHTAYMAMPLYHGMTLKQARSQMSGPPPEEWLRTVLWSILEALKVLHGGNTLHRDVSPDNVFLQDMGPPVLLDLGSARRAITDHSHKHTAVLKVNYAPIEQYADALDLKEGPWTDLYAVAAVVHGCVCNAPPVPATMRVVQDRMPPFAQGAHTAQAHFGTAYAARFCQAIDHGLALQPADRPQSVADWAQEMDLRTPEGVVQFDWRLALGPMVTLNAESLHSAHAATQVVASQQTTTHAMPPPGDTQSASNTATIATTTVATAAEPLPATPASTQSPQGVRWGWWLAAAAVLLVTAGWLNHNHAPVVVGTAPTPAPIAAAGKGESGGKDASEGKALCGHEPIWKRSWCVYQECLKPGMAKVPACVEERKRRENAIQKNNNF